MACFWWWGDTLVAFCVCCSPPPPPNLPKQKISHRQHLPAHITELTYASTLWRCHWICLPASCTVYEGAQTYCIMQYCSQWWDDLPVVLVRQVTRPNTTLPLRMSCVNYAMFCSFQQTFLSCNTGSVKHGVLYRWHAGKGVQLKWNTESPSTVWLVGFISRS